MIGKIIDMNVTDALISFQDGRTMDIGVSNLPPNSKIGDSISVSPKPPSMTNDKFLNLF